MKQYWVTIKNMITGETKNVFVSAMNESHAMHEAVGIQRAHVFEWAAVYVREAIASK